MAGRPLTRARRAQAARMAAEAESVSGLPDGQSHPDTASASPTRARKQGRPRKTMECVPGTKCSSTPKDERPPVLSGKDAETKHKRMGRPPMPLTEEIATEILERIASGQTLSSICRDPHMPARETVAKWLTCQEHSEFARRFAHARDAQIQFWADEILDAADDASGDYSPRQSSDGITTSVYNPEAVNRSRLKVDARKWLLSKLRPAQYGESARIEMTGKGGGPVEINHTPLGRVELARRLLYHIQRGADAQQELAVGNSGADALMLIEGQIARDGS